MGSDSNSSMPRRPAIAGLAFWLALCFAPAMLGAWFTPGAWYAGLKKPGWTPPGYLFGPVWTALYTMMGVAAWLVWRRGGFARHPAAMALFGAQLLLNAAWSPLFFGLRRPDLAAVEIALLWAAVALTIRAFYRIHRAAAWLLAPYLAWVTFAVALNFAIAVANP